MGRKTLGWQPLIGRLIRSLASGKDLMRGVRTTGR